MAMNYRFVGVLLFGLCSAGGAHAAGPQITVTLLGTGSPAPVMNRFGPSTLVEAGGQRFVFDAGRGALQRLRQAGVRWQDVDGVFLTHLHSDHLVGFPDLWLTGWFQGPQRDRPLRVWGPPGTQRMLGLLRRAFAVEIQARIADGAKAEGAVLIAHEIREGQVYAHDGVRISAFAVDHPPLRYAFGYRVDYGGRSVVLSGDTRHSENLVRHATGVDLLIHEVASPETFARAGLSAERSRPVLAHHVTPQVAGEVFRRTHPRLAVYSHIVQPSATEADLLPATRTIYDGPVVLGEDLMVIVVGDQVQVHAAQAAPALDAAPGQAPPRQAP
jgi:ribonuclease Z